MIRSAAKNNTEKRILKYNCSFFVKEEDTPQKQKTIPLLSRESNFGF